MTATADAIVYTVHPDYAADPANHYPDGRPAPAMPESWDHTYGAPTTDADIAASVDNQPIGAPGTGDLKIAQTKSIRTRKSAPRIGAAVGHILALEPYAAVRALADLALAHDSRPYSKLAAACGLTPTRAEAARLAAADDTALTDHPDQLAPTYKTRAERILADLDPAPADEGDDPELVYDPADDTTDGTSPADDEDYVDLADVAAHAPVDEAQVYALARLMRVDGVNALVDGATRVFVPRKFAAYMFT